MKRAKEELEYQMKKVTWFHLLLIGVKPFTGMTFGRRTLRKIMLNKMMMFSRILFSIMTFSGTTVRKRHSAEWHSVE